MSQQQSDTIDMKINYAETPREFRAQAGFVRPGHQAQPEHVRFQGELLKNHPNEY